MASLLNTGYTNKQTRSLADTALQAHRGLNKPEDRRFVRVVDVVLQDSDLTASEWKRLGCNQALYGIFFQDLFDSSSSKSKQSNLDFAYCRQGYLKSIPIKNEIVLVEPAFSVDVTQDYGTLSSITKLYWERILPIWHTPNYNPFPNSDVDGDGPADTGKYFKEAFKSYDVQLNFGDVLIEGRYGNSLRFGGTILPGLNSSVSGTIGAPYTILRNSSESAQYRDIQGTVTTILEDINKDLTSIYLVSDHYVDLKQAFTKTDSWKTGDSPVQVAIYKGAQIVSNTDRHWINARKDIVLTAVEKIALGAAKVGIDASDYIGIDATKVYLGANAFTETEPILKGSETTDWLQTLCSNLIELLDAIQSGAQTGDSKSFISATATAAASIEEIIKTISSDSSLSRLKSKKVYTE